MKYLKRFNESAELDQSVIDECKDILLELEDIGIRNTIHSNLKPILRDPNAIIDKRRQTLENWITIYLTRKEEFQYSDIEDVIERLKSYLSEFGLHIKWQSQAERGEQKPTIKVKRVMNPMTFTPQGVRTECEIYFTSN